MALDALRTQRIRVPPLPTIERLCGEVRARAHRQVWRTLTTGLTDAQLIALDRLLAVCAGGGQSTLAWLRQTAYAATAGHFPKLIERLRQVRALGIEPERATRIHQNHWLKLALEGGRSTVQHWAELEPLRRYATLTAWVLELTATLTGEALNRFEHLIASLFKKTARAHADEFHRSGKAINEKLRLYARIGEALIAARATHSDAFAAIEGVLPWNRFESTVAEAHQLAQPEAFDSLALNASGQRTMPEVAPTSFVKPRWRPHVFRPEGVIDRHFYELCTLSELRAGDVWVRGSRQYRDFESFLIPNDVFVQMQQEPLPLDIDTELSSYMTERRQCLQTKMDDVAAKARNQALPDVSLADGKLRISPLKKNTPASAVEFSAQAYTLMPHVKITELLSEVDGWTHLADHFVHLRTLAPPKHRHALLTAVLADGINLGLARMSEACRAMSWRQLTWTADWHIRDEGYARALAE